MEMKLYTAGYRDAMTDRRLAPAEFYAALPPEAAVVDIRSTPYSPFAPAYTRGGVRNAIERWKPGVKAFQHLSALGNTRRDSTGKRCSPPYYIDSEVGFPQLERLIREIGSVVIFCACSYSTIHSPTHRCHRFFVAEEMELRIEGLRVIHCEVDR